MDCVRMNALQVELERNPTEDAMLYSPMHNALFDLKKMTVNMDVMYKLCKSEGGARCRGN